MTISPDVSFLSYDDLRQKSESFLSRYNPNKLIPVPIEEIVEFDFEINIIPIPELHENFNIDGFTSSDLKDITVDEFVYQSRPGRYRFTLAHEIGHIVLHRNIFKEFKFSNIAGWKKFVKNIDEKKYSWIEWQAYSFAGLVLVPSLELKKAVKSSIVKAKHHEMDLDRRTKDITWSYISSWVSKKFCVSSAVVDKRIEKDKLKEIFI